MKIFSKFLVLFFLANSALAQNVASINPLYQILLAISQDKNNSILLIDPNFSEHDYQLKKSDVEALSKAQLVFYVNGMLEKNLPKLIKNFDIENKAFELSKLEGIKLLQKRNYTKNIDFHIWLNPKNAVIIAQLMAQKLCENDAKNCVKYKKNLAKFEIEAQENDKKIRNILAKNPQQNFVFYHDGYQYFEEYFAIKPLMILTAAESQDLGLKEVREFDALARAGKIKCIFGEKFDEKNSAKNLAQKYGIKFVVLDLVGQKGENYWELLQEIAQEIGGCL